MKHKNNQNSFFDNWQVKITCLMIAILVYFAFMLGVPGERKITLPLDIDFPENLTVTSLIPTEADVVIRGNDKQIYMIDVSKVKLSADFSGVKSDGVASAAIDIDYSDLLDYIDVKEVSIYTEPSIVKLYFEK